MTKYLWKKSSYTVDIYFDDLSIDVHVGPSSIHCKIIKVKLVQALNITDSETAIVVPISNRNIVCFVKLTFNFSGHKKLKFVFANQIKEENGNKWYSQFPSKDRIISYLFHTLNVHPEDLKLVLIVLIEGTMINLFK